MDVVEYQPQPGIGIFTLVRACVAAAVAVLLFSLGEPVPMYAAALPAAAAIAWFAAYAGQRRRRTRLTATGIESRRFRTNVIPWAQIRDVQVVDRAQAATARAGGYYAPGPWSSRSGGGARKVASVRVQQADGRWQELAMPAAWEHGRDPDFAAKADVIKDRWQASASLRPASVARATYRGGVTGRRGPGGRGGHRGRGGCHGRRRRR